MLTSSSESTYHRQYMVLQSIITLMLEASRYLGSSNSLENHTLWFRYKSIKMKQSYECCYSLAKCTYSVIKVNFKRIISRGLVQPACFAVFMRGEMDCLCCFMRHYIGLKENKIAMDASCAKTSKVN